MVALTRASAALEGETNEQANQRGAIHAHQHDRLARATEAIQLFADNPQDAQCTAGTSRQHS
jgi:hypothetical protein